MLNQQKPVWFHHHPKETFEDTAPRWVFCEDMRLLPYPNEIVMGLVNIGGVLRFYSAVLLKVKDVGWSESPPETAEEFSIFISQISWHSALMGTRIPRVVAWLHPGKLPLSASSIRAL